MKKLDIIYEDKELLVVNKPAKLLTISDGKTYNTLYSMASRINSRLLRFLVTYKKLCDNI